MLRIATLLVSGILFSTLHSGLCMAQESRDLKDAVIVIDARESARPFSREEVSVSRQIGPYMVRLVWRNKADFIQTQHSEQGRPVSIALEEYELQRMDPYRKLIAVDGNWCEALNSVHEMVCGDVLARAVTKINGIVVGLEISPFATNAASPYCRDGAVAFTWPLGSPPGAKCPMFDCNSSVHECYSCKDCAHSQDSTCSDSWTCSIVPPPPSPRAIAGQCIGALICTCQN